MLALSRYLAWLGVIPFIIGLILTLLDSAQLQFFFGGLNGEIIFVVYSAIILSFMSGALWGLLHRQPQSNLTAETITNSLPNQTKLILLVTNVWAVLAWIAVVIFLVLPSSLSFLLFLLALGYAHILWVEKQANLSNERYLNFRQQVTACVITLHLILLFVH